jgi:hypothetical protein
MRRLLSRAMLAALVAVLWLIPAVCCAAAADDPGCYPDGIEHAHPAAVPGDHPAGTSVSRRRGVGAIYKAAVTWLRNVIGSLTRPSSSKFGLERKPVRDEGAIIPSFRLDVRKARVQVGMKLRF